MRVNAPGSPGSDTDKVMGHMRGLAQREAEVSGWLQGMFAIGMEMPPRISFRQGVAFALVALGNAAGNRVTMTDVREVFNEAEPSANVGQSIAKSFQIFFEPSKQEPNGLGWVYQETDEDDRRKKYLYLTTDGADAVLRALDACRASEKEHEKLQTD